MPTIIFPRAPAHQMLCFMEKNKIKNTRDGYHLNSAYWQNKKKSIPPLSDTRFQIAFGMLLGDASIYKVSREAALKFEQGQKQRDFLYHLFDIFQSYCFMKEPGIRLVDGHVKSYWFKTFSHPSFSQLFDILCQKNGSKWKKTIRKGIILSYLTPKALAYWIMCDGSLANDGKSLILHTSGFSQEENILLSDELNKKFQLESRVISHKKKYCVVFIPSKNALRVKDLIQEHMVEYFFYKIPRVKMAVR